MQPGFGRSPVDLIRQNNIRKYWPTIKFESSVFSSNISDPVISLGIRSGKLYPVKLKIKQPALVDTNKVLPIRYIPHQETMSILQIMKWWLLWPHRPAYDHFTNFSIQFLKCLTIQVYLLPVHLSCFLAAYRLIVDKK